MALEIERKYPGADLDGLRARLGECGARLMAGPYLERNLLLDDPDRSLRARGMLLRLREKVGHGSVLTVKCPVEGDERVQGSKARQEHQTEIADFDACLLALEALGYRSVLMYEKVREKWRLGQVTVCLDRLPFGDFVELEGVREQFERVESTLGMQGLSSSAATYHDLNREHRTQHGLPDCDDFVFDDERRKRLLEEM